MATLIAYNVIYNATGLHTCKQLKSKKKPVYYVFDLDGTITQQELLPRIASIIGLYPLLLQETALALAGTVPYEQSLLQRFSLLQYIPLEQVHAAVAEVPLDASITRFIKKNAAHCCVATSNLDVWVHPLQQVLQCDFYCSAAQMTEKGIVVNDVLNKRSVVERLQEQGYFVVAVGDGLNDVSMFRQADLAVLFTGVHAPHTTLIESVDVVALNGPELCGYLEQIQQICAR